jgi:competence ComEA-like helix-hairpin-helix protein
VKDKGAGKPTFHLFGKEALVLFPCLVLIVVLSGLYVLSCGRGPSHPLEGDFKININEAGWEELVLLQDVGERRAMAIVEHRELAGPFGTSEDIAAVKGISANLARRIESQIVYE